MPPESANDDTLLLAQAEFLRYLAIALCVHTGVSPSDAEANARWLYTDAQTAYLTDGAIYGPGHAGLMRWSAERLHTPLPLVHPDHLSA